MDHTEQKLQTGKLICLILCALFALIALVCFWTPHIFAVSDNGNISAILSSVYVLIIIVGSLFHKNRAIRIVCCALSCLFAASWLLPLGGMKIHMLAEAFARGSGEGIALLIDCLRRIFMIAVHAVIVINVIAAKPKKMVKTESFLLQAALIFFISAALLSLFTSPAHPEPAAFAGLAHWKEFFAGLFSFSSAAFDAFDSSSAALFPICDGAVLLLLFSMMQIYNMPAERTGKIRAGKASAPEKSIAKTRITNDAYAQLQSLAAMRSQGIISDQEFYRRKRDLLEK